MAERISPRQISSVGKSSLLLHIREQIFRRFLFMSTKHYPCVLTIAGSDCSGGAGIQADIKTISALGAYAASVITAVTVQNTCGVTGIHRIPPEIIAAQAEAVMEDICPTAVKIGMINDAEAVHAIAETLRRFRPPHIVFDPVMISSSGRKLMEDEAVDAIQKELFPLCSLITPNIDEAAFLLQRDIRSTADMKTAARDLLRYGSKAVLLKGGHLSGETASDILQDGKTETYAFSAPMINSQNTHGTGCTLSSAIATHLALGESMEQAVRKSKEYVHHCLEAGKDVCIGHGHGPMNHFFRPEAMRIV